MQVARTGMLVAILRGNIWITAFSDSGVHRWVRATGRFERLNERPYEGVTRTCEAAGTACW